MLQNIFRGLKLSKQISRAPLYKYSDDANNNLDKNIMIFAANAADTRSSLQELRPIFEAAPKLAPSPTRLMDLGRNYFRHLNPRKKKTMIQMMDAYLDNLDQEEKQSFQQALEIYFDHNLNGKDMDEIDNDQLDLHENVLWHLFSLMIFDRTSSQYARFEYLDQFKMIEKFNSRPKKDINKVKYVFTSHPTQPNSLSQLVAISRMYQGIEQNDYNFLKYGTKLLIQANQHRYFNKTSYIEESVVYHSEYLPNMIKAVAQAYELGMKEPELYIDTPGTWLTFDFDNHPGMEIGIMTYTHGLTIKSTVKEYQNCIFEADLQGVEEFAQILELLGKASDYGTKLMNLSELLRIKREITSEEFFQQMPIANLNKIEDQIKINFTKLLEKNDEECKSRNIALKLNKLFQIFRLTGVLGQIRLAGEDLQVEADKLKPIIKSIMKEISLLNTNGQAADMIIIANYIQQAQYDLVKQLLDQYKIQGVKIVPLLETFASANNTDSEITMIASSDTRQRDGLLLTELRNMREYQRNPNKAIYLGQGITPERGGGPYELIHAKYKSLTRAQRKRHIRTIQGHYFTSEFASSDVAFTFLFNGITNINEGEDFEPSFVYMDLLFELDNIVGVPQREMQQSKEYNDLYVKNQVIKTLVESFNFGGSREMIRPFESLKKQRAIVQAYVNSDRCSYTHPELAYWDRLPEDLFNKIAFFYYNNHPHIKYVLYMYALMVKRCDLDFAKQEVGLDSNNQCFQAMKRGRDALKKMLEQLGLGDNSSPMQQLWKQHLGCSILSTVKEFEQKHKTFQILNKLQLYQGRKIVKNTVLDMPIDVNLRKLRILQSTLANLTSFTGKG